MGLIRKTLSVTSAVVAPGTWRGDQPGFVKYRSEAEEARREQTALLRQQTELLRQQAQPSADSAMAFYCADCVNAGCYAAGQLRVVNNPKLCDCTTHHS
jgi:hypothetical protein